MVGGQGGPAPDFTFAVVYRLRKWSKGPTKKIFEGGKLVTAWTKLWSNLGLIRAFALEHNLRGPGGRRKAKQIKNRFRNVFRLQVSLAR